MNLFALVFGSSDKNSRYSRINDEGKSYSASFLLNDTFFTLKILETELRSFDDKPLRSLWLEEIGGNFLNENFNEYGDLCDLQVLR
jgi:hypothetical protein